MNQQRTKIKICCISSLEEAKTAINAGADAIGLVGKMPSGPGPIADVLIAEIVSATKGTIDHFLLTSEQTAEGIADHHKRVSTETIQIVDEIPVKDYAIIREKLPGIKIVQVIHVTSHSEIESAKEIQQYVDALLLDSGNPKATIKTLGGTGNTHDWSISREIVKNVSIPVYLAGGLNASNVQSAIRAVRPFAVDICSGVRTNGKLDINKLSDFIREVRNIDNILGDK